MNQAGRPAIHVVRTNPLGRSAEEALICQKRSLTEET
jgi:hypothetical protein